MARTPHAAAGPPAAELRLDRWLWHARFYRSRALAAAAVSAGHVRVNGARAKPARVVRVGDQVELSLSGRGLECHVLALPARRGPPAEARLAYAETQASIARGVLYAQNQRLGAFAAPRPEGRPDKKERRQLLALGRAQAGGGSPGAAGAEADWDGDYDDDGGDGPQAGADR